MEAAAETTRSVDMIAVVTVLQAVAKSVRERDVDALMAHCATDIVVFDMVPPLEHRGADAVRAMWQGALAEFQSPIEYQMQDMEVTTAGRVAVCRSLNRFGGRRRNGTRTHNWLRSTVVLRKLGGRWKIVHEHVSVPFDMSNGKALLDLTPEAS